jgi:transcription-repair coupling factor (superfamily II helicase)
MTEQRVFERAVKAPELLQAAARIARGQSVRLGNVWGSSAALAAAALGRMTQRPVLLVRTHLEEADESADDVETLSGTPALLLPAWEIDIGTEHRSEEVGGERLKLCDLLAGAKTSSPGALPGRAIARTLSASQRSPGGRATQPFVVASVISLLQPVPAPAALEKGRLPLRKGGTLDPQRLAAWLVDAGYEPAEQVDAQGEFARRGGIVDIFPPGADRAIRLEFFGDQIESIRFFDLDTQRSTDEIDGCDVLSATAGRGDSTQETTNFATYLPKDTLVCMVNPGEVAETARQIYRRASETTEDEQQNQRDEEASEIIASDFALPLRRKAAATSLLDPEGVLGALGDFPRVELHPFVPGAGADVINLGIRSLERLPINSAQAIDELGELAATAEVWIYCENPAERTRFEELLAQSHPKLAGKARLAIGHPHGGFYWPGRKLAVVGHHEIFHRYAKVRRLRRVREGRPIDSLLDLREGDYVVHVGHGIARFEGLRILQREGRSEEYLTLRFADRAVLHVPASQIHLVQKYIGAGHHRPTLSHLGGTGWAHTKDRVAEAVKDMAADLLHVQAMRQVAPGLSYPRDTEWQRRFAEEFVYVETEDQLTSMARIDEDMAAPRPMDRLLCGDVGYGKTELAMRAAFKVAEAGRQTAVLVPTTVLADQHYNTFRERMADYPFEVEVLSRFRHKGQQAQVVKRVAEGQVDILIGTHRILSADIRFHDLGLVVIDEEQRFGVGHKERLKNMRSTVDVLTMTATPIPRTLHMALLGLRDISALSTPPIDRRSIHTEVCHYDDRLIRQAILRELNRQGQVFFVHNRVADLDVLARRLRALVPEAKMAVGHGQMNGDELEEIMLRFVRREVDVLVCTTIIESGLDIPTANTMIIHNADRFGLSELHQLRGRVGRYKHRAYCYLLLPEGRPVSAEAAKRLKTIEEFSDLGAGFQIAMRDLEIRGAGNILGSQQSGHIASVGYELYCQLLQHAVGALRGEAPAGIPETHVELGLDSYIPRNYIPADRQRMEVYRRLGRCASPGELRQLRADLADAYGAVPPSVATLLDLAEIRVRAAGAGIESIIRMAPDIVFKVRDFKAASKVFKDAPGTVRLPDDHTAHWRPPAKVAEPANLMRQLLKQLSQG